MTTQIAPNAEPQIKKWTREEYYRLAEEGYFRGQRVQLIHGEIIQMPPLGHAHVYATTKLWWFLEAAFKECWVRHDLPLNVGRDSDPEPDLAVVRGTLEDYRDHPETAIFVAEVSDTSLHFDTGTKAHFYAAARIPEYWVVNLQDLKLTIHRDPVSDSSAPEGARYGKITHHLPSETVSPLAHPEAMLRVADLFQK